MNHVALILLIQLTVSGMLCAQISWTKHTIGDNFDGACSVYAIDINGDSHVDVLGAAMNADRIVWWENSGSNPIAWTEQTIDSSFNGACYVYAADVDGDDDIDVLGTAWYGNEITFWENDGNNPVEWIKQTIDGNFVNAHEVYALDMDGDGDVDVLGASAGLNEITWWRNDGGDPLEWAKQTIDSTFTGSRSVYAIDVDGDSLVDVLGAAYSANDITLWLNNGDDTWTKQTIDSSFYGAHKVYACDVDGDDDIDVLGAGYNANAIAWWRNDGGNPIDWVKQLIDGNFYGALGVYATDVDNDSITDVLGTSDIGDDVAWWHNDGSIPIQWTEQTIDDYFDGAWPVYAKDMDNDGDADVLSAAYYADEIAWWENSLLGVEEHGAAVPDNHSYGPTIISGQLALPHGKHYLVYDIMGRAIDPLQLRSGIYFIEVDGEIVKKVIKIR
jgi:hypothetical protein